MNCFHFCIFELSKASNFHLEWKLQELWIAFIFVSLNYQKHLIPTTIVTNSLLWIAFIFVSLNYQKHLIINYDKRYDSCELLSFLYLWTIKSIPFSLSLPVLPLWIAFIFVSLNYQKHPTNDAYSASFSCELLSFLYLWTIKSINAHHDCH